MRLPDMTIPDIPLPIEIAAHIHPSVVHFAIVIPVIVLLLEVYNVAAKRPSISLFSFFLLLVLVFVLASSYLTGEVDAKNALNFFSSEAKGELKEHKQIGIFLLYASLVLLSLKLLFMSIRKTWGRILFILIQSIFVLAILYQSKQGGILVYKHGANVETVRSLQDSSSKITASNKEMSEHLHTLQAENNQLKQKNLTLSKSIENLNALKQKAIETIKHAKEDANVTTSIANQKAEKLLSESQAQAEKRLSDSQTKAEKLLSESQTQAETLLNNAKQDANTTISTANQKAEKLLSESKTKAESLLKNAKEEADKLEKSSRIKAETLLSNSKNEAAEIVIKANKAAQIIIKNAQESTFVLKQLMDNATASIVPKTLNESNASHY